MSEFPRMFNKCAIQNRKAEVNTNNEQSKEQKIDSRNEYQLKCRKIKL